MSDKNLNKKSNLKSEGLKETSDTLLKDSWRKLKRNKLALVGMSIVILFIIVAILAPYLTPYDPVEQLIWTEGAAVKLAPPSADHLFGTDLYGRDILTRVIYGARISLQISIAAMSISVLIGIILGTLAGYYGGIIDDIISWIINVLYAFPFLLFVIAIVAFFPPSLILTFSAISLVYWMSIARVVRGQVLSIKEKEFVEAARALGVKDWKIMFKHILPNIIAPVIVQATLGMGSIIMIEASLTYLGFGTQPPTPSWGYMISAGQGYLAQGQWWWGVFPAIAIILTVLGFNLFGDGLRDALDPKSR
ncbi:MULTISPECIES: ABC transporter permease [unclassified Halanaerobium]|uniref:ABC transporter permease n=1 Tax=unclassified Halanaerobium TaxID=2641197 RepID=UPI000E1649BC|nr:MULTISPECIES: ABC transporter permease [unclassified Halanaerobium]RCW48775.1 peptide/nickel transport system permease protein/oligopeptide transport system permease protein [Halanaerobium sp. MA284_MarDTE_T2]RCW89117.1 peptide/nickel transport system permease protein/oligopeptide transport system permease protein [Halanaerobium sp. DL-01]